MSSTLPALLSLVALLSGAIITGLVTRGVSRRQNSGGINTSQASDLWQAAEQMREEQAAEIRALRAEVTDLKTQIATLSRGTHAR